MKKTGLILLIFLVAILVSAASAQSPDSKVQTGKTADSDTQKNDYSKEAYVIERFSTRYRFEADGTGTKTSAFRVHVLSESGVQGFGQLRFGYNAINDRLDLGYVRVIKPDGAVVPAGPEAVQDLTPALQANAPVYTDYHEKHVTVPGLRPGDTLECEVKTVFHTPLAAGQFWMQHDFNQSGVVLDEQLEIDIPAARTVKLKTKPGHDPKITDANGRRVYFWNSSHLEGSEQPKGDKTKTDKKKKKKTDETPDVQMTTFASWEEVGRWYASLEKDRRLPSPEVRAKAQQLTKGLTSDLDRTETLYTFVAQNFRYVSLSLGLARYQPQPAADVLRNQYGDCKDKNTLLAALLEAEGLHSSTVLINTFRQLDPDVPSPSQFNHAITLMPIGKDTLWLDTTTEVAPFRLISYSLRKKQALVIPPGGTPHLEETPSEPFVSDKELTEIEGKIDESGRLEATVRFTVRGDSEIIERAAFRRIAPAQWQKLIEGINKSLGGDVSGIIVGDVLSIREPFTFSYRVSEGNFVDWQKKKVQVKLPLSIIGLVPVDDDIGEQDAPDTTKPEPFKLGPAHEHSYKIKLDFDPRFHVAAPVPISLDRDYGRYRSTYKVDGTTFAAERTLNILLTELPPDRAQDYRAFRRSVFADDGQLLSLESSSITAPPVAAGMKPADLIRDAGEARRNGHYGTAVELLNRAVEAEPKHKTAWNDLGLTYLDDRQDKLAINAFQKQIEVDPFSEYAFNNIGRVYLRQRNYEEADKWFKKQIEIQPLDKYAHSNLGTSLIEQHKYDQAIPELEKAASITPDNSGPQINLGRAHLHLGQNEKAMAAFDKAISISATPSTWNSIAYDLSLKKTHLDRARSYAESAISTTSASLRNISLDQVNRRDPANVSALASYWDTLGWIAFAEGKIDEAERYVSAAWQLGGHAEEADHLGQIFEQKGKKAEAIHLYAMALSAERPEPETRDRLAALVGTAKVDEIIEKYKADQLQSRTYRVANADKIEGKADFFMLLTHASMPTMPDVQDVHFIDGEQKLKRMSESLKVVKLNLTFPDESQAKILRRGTLTCSPDIDCNLVLALPSEVRSID